MGGATLTTASVPIFVQNIHIEANASRTKFELSNFYSFPDIKILLLTLYER